MPNINADKEELTSGKFLSDVVDDGSTASRTISNTHCDLALEPTPPSESSDAAVKAEQSEAFDSDEKNSKIVQAVKELSDDDALHADKLIKPTHPDVVARHHEALRKAVKAAGVGTLQESLEVWKKAVADENALRKYARAMESSATEGWGNHKGKFLWVLSKLDEYLFADGQVNSRLKDEKRTHFANTNGPMSEDALQIRTEDLRAEARGMTSEAIMFLDVGSCYDPLRKMLRDHSGPSFPVPLQVTSLDLCPTVDTVYKTDFLMLSIQDDAAPPPPEATKQHLAGGIPMTSLPRGQYHAVLFSLLLEYIPTPDQRLLCIEKAFDLLVTHGVLFVVTPRSTAKKADKLKEWRAAIEGAGFVRWRVESQTHVHLLAFRKIDVHTDRQWVGRVDVRRNDRLSEKKSKLGVPRDISVCSVPGPDADPKAVSEQ